ncbi:TRAP transporter large permease [Deferrisoma palaeochoriense]
MSVTGVLLGVLAGLFLLEVPIAVAIGLASVAAFVAGGDFPLITAVQRMYGGVDSFPLMAVPLFLYAGGLMEAGGISRRIVAFADALVGWLPGGLAAVAVASAMFFAGISGSAAADTAAVGGILVPAMISRGYAPAFAGAVQAAGGSIGVVIPPSIPMIIFGFLTGASIGKLFAAGILPGVLMGTSLIAVSALVSRRRGYGASQAFSLARVWTTFRDALWALGAPVVILGGILGGVFTATESAAVAVGYAVFVGRFVYRELRWRDMPPIFVRGSITAAVILFIISAASAFSWLLAIEDIPSRLSAALLGITENPVLLMLLVNAVLLVAGTFVETTASLILLVPVIVPLAPKLGVDLTQLGVIVVMNLAIGMLTPPLGICLIVSCALANERIAAISRAVLPFLLVLLADLLLVSFWPPLTHWFSG